MRGVGMTAIIDGRSEVGFSLHEAVGYTLRRLAADHLVGNAAAALRRSKRWVHVLVARGPQVRDFDLDQLVALAELEASRCGTTEIRDAIMRRLAGLVAGLLALVSIGVLETPMECPRRRRGRTTRREETVCCSEIAGAA